MNASIPRKRNRSSRIASLLIVVLVLSGIIGATIHFVLTSPRFKVKDVHVQGLERISSDEILVLTRSCVGQPLFTVDIAAVCRAVENRSLVRRARVIRQLPSTIIVVVVEERHTYALLEHGHDLLEVDDEGVILGVATGSGCGQGLCCIRGIDAVDEADTLGTALAVLTSCSEVDIPVISVVHKEDAEGFVLELDQGAKLILGQSPDQDMLRYVPSVLQDLREHDEKASVIDLRFFQQAVVTLSRS